MHTQGIVHGNIKGVCVQTHSHPSQLSRSLGPKPNILVDRNNRALLAGFGLTSLASDNRTFISSCMQGGTIKWMSPELLDPEMFGLKKSHPTKESDCYMLGMVIYEVLSGQTPFAPSSAPVIIRKVLDGKRPERPQGSAGKLFTDGMWRMTQRCWEPQPRDRIGANDILLGLEGNPTPLQPSSNVDGDMEIDSDDESDDTASDSGMFSPLHPRLILNHNWGISGLLTPLRPSPNVDGDVEADLGDQPNDTANNSSMFLLFHPRLIFNYNCGISGLPITLRPSPNVGGDVEIDRDDQPDDTASDSGMFSPFRYRLVLDYNCGM
jgi:serine/threonine protein kinase